jgi:hypothetical protein
MKLVSSPVLLLLGVLACAALVHAAEVRFVALYVHLSVDLLGFKRQRSDTGCWYQVSKFPSCSMFVSSSVFLRHLSHFGEL